MTVKVLIGRAGAKPAHADEGSGADHRVPTEPDRRFDRDLDRRGADDTRAIAFILREKQIEAGHRYDARGYALFFELILRRHAKRDLRARGEQRDLRLALGGYEFVGAARALVGFLEGRSHGRQVLAGEREHARAARVFERELPALGRLRKIGRAEKPQLWDRPQRRQMLDRLE